MLFRISGLSPEPFRHLDRLCDAELADFGVIRRVADSNPGYPDRIAMRDAEIGEPLLLMNHFRQPAQTPYRASHAIFIREGADRAYAEIDRVPDVMRRRVLSLRTYDQAGMMLDADLGRGKR
jgi:hypothetical protein